MEQPPFPPSIRSRLERDFRHDHLLHARPASEKRLEDATDGQPRVQVDDLELPKLPLQRALAAENQCFACLVTEVHEFMLGVEDVVSAFAAADIEDDLGRLRDRDVPALRQDSSELFHVEARKLFRHTRFLPSR